MNDRELEATCITSPYFGVSQVKISQYMDICLIFLSESLLCEFSNLSTDGREPCFSQPFASAWLQQTKNGSCILPGSVLPGSNVLYMGKWTKRYDWLASLKCTSLLAVAQPQEIVGFWQTLSLPLDTCVHRHETDYFICSFRVIFHHECKSVIQFTYAWQFTHND